MNHFFLPGGSRIPRTSFLSFILAGLVLAAWSPSRSQTGFRPDLDHSIDLESAVQFVTSFRLKNAPDEPAGETFGRDAVLALLDQPGCAGLRIYYGAAEDGRKVLVLVGVDVEGKDMYLGLLDEKGIPCPPVCDESSPFTAK